MVVRIAVLGSSGGYAFDYLFTAVRLGLVDAEVVAVVTDRECRTEEVAKAHGLPYVRINQNLDISREEYSERLEKEIPEETDLVVLSLRRLVGEPLLSRFSNRILNTHPSLLPSYPGFGAVEKLLTEGKSLFGGASCHLVNKNADDGPMVIQSAIPLSYDDDNKSWALKVWDHQKKNLSQAVQFFSEKRVRVSANTVHVIGGSYGTGFTNPALEIDFSPVDRIFQVEPT